jgi:hypothetical protein
MAEEVSTEESDGSAPTATAEVPTENNTTVSAETTTETAESVKDESAEASWSTILQSPSDLASYSPSKDIISDGNLHGLGVFTLTLAFDLCVFVYVPIFDSNICLHFQGSS